MLKKFILQVSCYLVMFVHYDSDFYSNLVTSTKVYLFAIVRELQTVFVYVFSAIHTLMWLCGNVECGIRKLSLWYSFFVPQINGNFFVQLLINFKNVAHSISWDIFAQLTGRTDKTAILKIYS